MPVLRFKPGRVEEVLELGLGEALRQMERLKIEAGIGEDGFVEVEVEVDRPDMYSLEGIARQLAGLLGRAEGIPRYEVVETDYVVRVEGASTRPYIVGFVVWDVDVDEDYLPELIQLQEKLTLSHGLARRRVAIGLHDLDKLPSKRLRYVMKRVDEVVFRPLGGEREMTLREVLDSTEQGRAYGKISLAGDMHPVLYSGDEVISVPPVINSETTRVEPGTRSLFVDVTGTELGPVVDIASVLAAGLAERSRSSRIGLVTVEAPWGVTREPSMKPRPQTLDPAAVKNVLGVEISAEEAARLLRAMRFDAEPAEGRVRVLVPRYRLDILHEVDLVEEIMLALGVENLQPLRPSTAPRGGMPLFRWWEREARKILAFYGFVEVKTYSLVPCWLQELAGFESLRLSNPVSTEAECFRASLLPQLLQLASRNQHVVPLLVFETGEVMLPARRAPPGEPPVEYRHKLSLLVMRDKAGYEDVQAVVYGLLGLLGDSVEKVEPLESRLFIEGRAARLTSGRGVEAVLGEVNPEVLERLGLKYPVAMAEIDYTGIGGAAVPRP